MVMTIESIAVESVDFSDGTTCQAIRSVIPILADRMWYRESVATEG